MMNDKAKAWGMDDTCYTNPNGFTESGMFTSARDVMILAEKSCMDTYYSEICSSIFYTIGATNMHKDRYIYNSNYLIAGNVEKKYRNSLATGINAGSTVEGGYVLVTKATKNGATNLYVIMGAASDDENIYSYTVANELIKLSFENYGYLNIADQSEMVCEIPIELSNGVDHVVLSPKKSIEHYLPSDIDITKEIKREIDVPEKLQAPIAEGETVGSIRFLYNGEEIASVELISKTAVARNGLLYILARIRSITSSGKFKITAAILIIAAVLYGAGSIYRKIRKSMRENDVYRRK